MQTLKRSIRNPFSIIGYLFLLVTIIRGVQWVVGTAGDVAFIAEHWSTIWGILNAPWFSLITAIVGIVLLAIAPKIKLSSFSHTRRYSLDEIGEMLDDITERVTNLESYSQVNRKSLEHLSQNISRSMDTIQNRLALLETTLKPFSTQSQVKEIIKDVRTLKKQVSAMYDIDGQP